MASGFFVGVTSLINPVMKSAAFVGLEGVELDGEDETEEEGDEMLWPQACRRGEGTAGAVGGRVGFCGNTRARAP